MISSNSLTNKKERRFQSLALLTIIAIYILVLAGGIVRGTGSGMGCPDWPKCFGRWVPPTEISQLPANYQKIYGAKLKGEIEFNPVKTWIEYVNRLVGVLSGFLVFATLLASLSFWRKDKVIVWGSFTAFFLIGLNGWLGSKVVSTELAQYMITIHMLLAILVVFALLFVWVRSRASQVVINLAQQKEAGIRWLALGLTIITIGQIVLGTEVREALDLVVKKLGYDQRQNWISSLDWRFYVHRSFSLVVLAGHLTLVYQLRKLGNLKKMTWVANGLLACLLLEIGTGVVMAYLNVPAVAQPVHLLLAILLVGLQFIAVLALTPGISLPKAVKRNMEVAHA
ncbi:MULTISPECIES: heme A synthase [unclassified Spirosoma]|uniref:COX15/CtaA family protein n=1 Tax=unclassified Spirosoma TaxID=2621999 RepID=UPI00095CAAA0|nr:MULTISPECIES: COX15/CtaA family protein [unclassified Spirosoma]MBN8822873.1 COX15/CtaA family protein [Spirosoma sp.]OJW80066.1 MAG: heme A synthase [Spirosoma sp. 48-14]